MNRTLYAAIIVGVCLLFAAASAVPTITTSISATATGSNVRQYAMNIVKGSVNNSSVVQSISLSSSGTGSTSQWANNAILNGDMGVNMQNRISQDATGTGGKVQFDALHPSLLREGTGRISQSIVTKSDSVHLVQEQANIVLIDNGTGMSVMQKSVALGNSALIPDSFLKQVQLNKVLWVNGATGSAVQETFAYGSASILERIQQNDEYWLSGLI